MRTWLSACFLLLLPWASLGQGSGVLSGVVTDPGGLPLTGANVTVEGTRTGVACDANGRYELRLPADTALTIRFSFTGMVARTEQVRLAPGEERRLSVQLTFVTLNVVDIEARRERESGLEKIDPKLSTLMPNPQGGVEALLRGQMGFVSRNELSAGYSVRGGNFDENLVYVNNIEVYRPFLVRAGQQEGLSFPNPDLIERIQFSAGGFEARYGDKMSSVLDIRYKRPKEFHGSAMASLLGGSFHIESAMAKKRIRQVTGFRYRTNRLVLEGLDTEAEYDPRYTDLQSYWTYDASDKVEIGLLGIYSRNRYDQVPQSRETELGNFDQALRFTVFFDGRERTQFETFFGALNVNVKARKDMLLQFTTSAYRTFESERFDILGQYFLDELDRDLGSDQFGEVVRNLGVGTFLDHARNDLDATVLSFAHKGYLEHAEGAQYLQWGADARIETINDKLSEWTMIDSADYSIPQSTGEDLELQYSLKSRLDIESTRLQAYVQNSWSWDLGGDRGLSLIAGVRGQHWTYNGQTVVSPRFRLNYRPGWRTVNTEGDTVLRDYSFWLAGGLYYQPPFYRELRRLDGTLNPDIRAQRSIHVLLGMDRLFTIWERPFKFSAEAYYKAMDDLIPYEVDNVRIRYYGTNNSRGYAAGLDMKLNGEFVKGVESWISMGVLSTFEDLTDDFYYDRFNANGDLIVPGFTFDQVAVDSVRREPGNIPRPTDQRVNFALFFQDEMPKFPTFKVHVNLVFGTGLPFGPPNETRYADTLRTSLYRRVDIGFSKQFLGAPGQPESKLGIQDLFLTVEVFNLLDINNTIDYTWVQDVGGRYYAIPDFLTPRRLNVKLVARF